MRTSILGAMVIALISVFGVTATPANAAGVANCSAYVGDVTVPQGPGLTAYDMKAEAGQRCTGTYAYHSVKVMLQRYVKRKHMPDTWQTVAQNYQRAYQPDNNLEIKVKRACNPRSPVRKYRAVGTFMVKMPNGVPTGKSVRSMYEIYARC